MSVQEPTMFVQERGSGRPLVLIHGFGVDHRLLLPLDDALEAAGGWRRLYLDLPGATRTPAGDLASTNQVADAVLAEVQARLGREPFALLGNSFGAMLARHVAHALRPQVLGLATLAGVFVAEHAGRDVPDRVVLARDDRAADALGPDREAYRDVAVTESSTGVRDFVDHVLPGLRGADAEALDRIARRYALDPVPEVTHPDPFVQPSLHITGRQDHVVGYRDAWAHLEHYPRATFVVLDGAGHNVHLDQASLCAGLLGDWLRRMDAAAAC